MAEHAQYVTLGVAEELFAAPVAKVQEILDMRPIARLPQAPDTLLGMIDVRGQGIPVVDLPGAYASPQPLQVVEQQPVQQQPVRQQRTLVDLLGEIFN